ncbi:MAG: hypothetical protein A2015_14810 [Spirochaetes bacterium GWF1_31_7]|nr:MAG: hypothetical protein A2Y30_12070 [Spirochaetes bacterium GWE1_32_154]OHD49419.1 MAG: hypothetical protein A2015_14810 [Spirochaetes bacterium GWF1_31_7]OHD51560.1 MAG: hypothetical protein A2Y29_15370 [Spirochaetes bacterium GWE2_31_10]OHD82719.1 MAG: hypothetical protein A2355_04755 [Spirochaetes bacterium RIFOXYB1_FULL_32_8]HBD93614.1 hypothetical protein [Spirochaetia bacterium]
MKNENLFMEITNIILKYENGDLLALSSLSDLIYNLKNITTDNSLIPYIDETIEVIKYGIKEDNYETFTKELSKRVDYIQNRMVTEILFTEKKSTPVEKIVEIEKMQGVSDELINIFIVEAEDRIANAQRLILELENSLSNSEIIDNLFQIFHTIKGECGFLKIETFGNLTHSIEHILDLLRNKKIEINSNVIDRLLEGVDLSTSIIWYLKKGILSLPDTSAIEEYLKNIELIKKSSVNPHIIIQEKKDEVLYKHEKKDELIKVKSSKVNYIVDMIGELLIASGQIADNSVAVIQTRKITKLLQYAGMQLRTESIKTLFGSAKRMVRDISQKLNKVVSIDVFGDDLEIDRNLIESLEEPMMHLLRNAIHHGIENESDRLLHGKPASGHITIGAERKGNNIVISIKDDGQGLNKNKIISKALEKGFIKQNEIESSSDNQIYNMIFLNGFSTTDSVDLVSGRGVGMNIVKSVVEAHKGRIEILTESNKYSQFMLKFPLSTAIIDGMIVRIEDSLFIIPISSMIESIKCNPINIHPVNTISIYKLRDEIFPIIDLKKILGIDQVDGKNDIGIVVESSTTKRFLLKVDEIIAKKEIVIKSLGSTFKKLQGISSGCVLSGGKIGFVFDIDQIVEISKASNEENVAIKASLWRS